MKSLWEQSPHFGFEPLQRDLNTEVLIIGGGIAGVLCAHHLDRAGVPYALLEAKTIGGGVTQNTTAKITAQHGLIYQTLARKFGLAGAGQYLSAQQEALAAYRDLCQGVDCDYMELPAYVYAQKDAQKLQKELDVLQQLGADVSFQTQVPLPFAVAGAVRMEHQAQFHPIKFLNAIATGLNIYEHTPVQQLIGTTAITENGTVRAQKIIVATHFPFLNKHGSYFLKMYQHRSYVIALSHAANVQGMYIDAVQDGLSFRNHGDLLLVGGGGHRTGKRGGNWRALRDFARRFFPKASEVAAWATQDCITLDGMPYLGRYSARTPNLYVATGFNKWGMSTSMVAAKLLCDLVQGRQNPYEELFSPSRSMLRWQLAANAMHSTIGLLTPTTPRCPHLGCALKWNACERTWDCPCHGSRFTEEGRCIDNPSTGDLPHKPTHS